jgi:hypothetical protein
MPPTLACRFTTGELAVLRIVADAVRDNGQCVKTIPELAARAGVCRTTAQNAIRPRVVEIGAGMGRACYYAHKLGLRNYTIIDLPMTLIGQALFLAATLGEDRFSLPGETSDAEITLSLPENFENLGNFHLAYNSDSLPEMSHRQARRYFALMRKQCQKFLSINHEDNGLFFVRDFERPAMRMQYPLREGFFEEVYDLRSPGLRPLFAIGKMTYRRARGRLLCSLTGSQIQ